MPVPWMALAAASYLAKSGYDIYSSWKGKKESTSQLGELSKSFQQRSPYEQEWLSMLRRRMKKGALPVREMMQRVSSRVGEQGQVARQRAQGYAASQGLEHSGVAASMTGMVDAQMLRAIADQARAIAIQNEMTKTGAQQEFGQYAMGESDLIRQLAAMKYGAQQGISQTAYQRTSEGIGGFGRAAGTMAGGQQESGWRQGPDGRWYWRD